MNRLTPEELEAEAARIEALRDQPIDLTDPDCPPSPPDRKWYRGAPPFMRSKKIVILDAARKERPEAEEILV